MTAGDATECDAAFFPENCHICKNEQVSGGAGAGRVFLRRFGEGCGRYVPNRGTKGRQFLRILISYVEKYSYSWE